MATEIVKAKVLEFPEDKIHPCPTCDRACSDEELFGCLRCGQQYCKHDDWDDCACGRMAEDLARRLPEPHGLLSRLLAIVGVTL
jgi:hypothetical protein